jgi:hypothetical protein
VPLALLPLPLLLPPPACLLQLLPDLARRCPAVDPDQHHIFVSLGCAAENLIQAALAHGLKGEAQFDPAGDGVRVTLAPAQARITPLFSAIPLRQCTRGDYDGLPLAREDLALLQEAGTSSGVRLRLLTDRPAMERALEYIGPDEMLEVTPDSIRLRKLPARKPAKR